MAMPSAKSVSDAHTHAVSLPGTDLSTAYLQYGDPQGIPILCLHGNLGSKRWWWPVLEIMPDEFHVIAPDLRGCGESRFDQARFDMPALLSDLQQLTDHLNLRQLTMVAHSTSCAIALEYALHFSYNLSSLVLVSCPPLDGIVTPPAVYRYLQTVLRDREETESLLQSLMPKLDLSIGANQNLMTALVEDAQKASPRAVDGITRSLETWSCRERVGQLATPVLVVRGRDDHITPHGVAIDTLLTMPSANNLEVIQGAGHSPFIENPLAFVTRLIDFVVQDFVNPALD